MSAPNIRPYRDADLDGVLALWAQTFPEPSPWNEPRDDIRLKLGVQPELFLVADLHGAIVGTAMGGFDGHRGWVHYVASDPALRGRGIARLLLTDLESRLRALGCKKLNLQVRGSNGEVVRFYERLGFVVEDRISLGKRL